MSAPSLLHRLAAMDREELRFRTVCEARKLGGRVRFAAARPRWRRRNLARLLDGTAGPLVREAQQAAGRGDAVASHLALARHFQTRGRRWPVAAGQRDDMSRQIRDRFPMAGADARDRADAIVSGRYDLLGFRGLALGNPPDWHHDAVHGRRAPRGYWATVPFLDAASGDHKVIWEVNRHQHFLPLGAAWWLTGDPRFRETFIAHLESWLADNPPLDGVNWASMLELAFRTMSWTWAVEFFCAGAEQDRTPWLVDLFVALDRQLTHVEQNLSTYFSPNTHISGEALALYAVSRAFPELRRSQARAALARDILLREARAQIRPDGGHAELSSHYHRYSTDFYLLALQVARLTDDPVAEAFEGTVRAQASFLRTIADGRGQLPNTGDDDAGQLFAFRESPSGNAASTLAACAALLDDEALAVSTPGPELFWILGEAPRTVLRQGVRTWPSRVLADSGYFVSRADDRGHHLVFDAGPHGFLNGGHAHADALSVLLTVSSEPLLVDPGTGTYTMDPALRDRLRAPDMHNTVTIDGAPFARPRGPFHWQRVTDARMPATRIGADVDFAVGTHDGYGFPLMRAVLTIRGHGWLIVDRLSPPATVRADAWWHLHPAWSATPTESGFGLRHATGARLALATTAADRSLEITPYSPEYGRVVASTTLRTGIVAAGPAVMAAYVPSAAGARPARVALAATDRDTPGWTTYRFSMASEAELLVSVAFPDAGEPQPPSADWPQPCIQEARAVCVE